MLKKWTRLSLPLKRLAGDKKGITALEYGLLAAAIVTVTAVGFGSLANKLSSSFSNIGNSISTTTTSGG